MGDNREEINLEKGVWKCNYALVVISKFTVDSVCAMEELSIIESKYRQGKIIVFPVVYELSPNDIPDRLCWIKELIFKEVDRHSGTREVCSHIVCKITGNILNNCIHQKVRDISPHLKKFCHLGCMTSSVVIYKLIMQILTAESLYFMQHTWLLLIQKE